MADGLSPSDRDFLTAAILTAPMIHGTTGVEHRVKIFNETLAAIAKGGSYQVWAAAKQEASSAKGGLG